MRRFDNSTGVEMFVSEYKTNGLHEWYVLNGYDQLGNKIEVAAGSTKNINQAVKMASEIYDDLVESIAHDIY